MNIEQAKRLEETLTQAMEFTAQELLNRAKDGTITSAEAAVVAKLCKDNQITIDLTTGELPEEVSDKLADSEDDGLTNVLPFPTQKVG